MGRFNSAKSVEKRHSDTAQLVLQSHTAVNGEVIHPIHSVTLGMEQPGPHSGHWVPLHRAGSRVITAETLHSILRHERQGCNSRDSGRE
ncbi:unnamed protein product [Somion occarium]|uniref:Uncharacterized protein n=1 Tax=Somion occarium TaxID=3059160 RepID=A0ABP1DJU8_9APHY